MIIESTISTEPTVVDKIINALMNPKFGWRTLDAICHDEGLGKSLVEGELQTMIEDDIVDVTTRSTDGKTIYRYTGEDRDSLVFVPVVKKEELRVNTNDALATKVRGLIGSASKYNYRTAKGVAEELEVSVEQVQEVLDLMDFNDEVSCLTRRSDGARLYRLQ